jgi:hypothetical protein
MTKPDAMVEWPSITIPENFTPLAAALLWQSYYVDIAEYWEQRCRLAVEALETIKQSDQANGVSTEHLYYERVLKAIGPLPERTD